MYKGIYIALSGATLKQTQVDIISQNLANASTLGYKKDKVAFQEYLLSQMNGQQNPNEERTLSDLATVKTDFSTGNIVRTGNPLDVAVDGTGFISLEDGKYTRRGDLKLSNDGYIVTQQGTRVLGKNGPIRISGQGTIDINPSGDVSLDGLQIDRIKVVDFPDMNALRKSGEDTFETQQIPVVSKATVKQGYVETSNIEVVRELVQLIAAMREFEMAQKAVQSFDDATAKVTNDMARM
ncbi:MAG: flagellar basal-body rod protein FlgF [Nitrospiraceae bacterium]|nr:flagellar basal-body rod protein FlgF [Nitrospiraceae bacterium]